MLLRLEPKTPYQYSPSQHHSFSDNPSQLQPDNPQKINPLPAYDTTTTKPPPHQEPQPRDPYRIQSDLPRKPQRCSNAALGRFFFFPLRTAASTSGTSSLHCRFSTQRLPFRDPIFCFGTARQLREPKMLPQPVLRLQTGVCVVGR